MQEIVSGAVLAYKQALNALRESAEDLSPRAKCDFYELVSVYAKTRREILLETLTDAEQAIRERDQVQGNSAGG